MQTYDPYQGPALADAAPLVTGAYREVPPAIVEAMRQTRPWVLFLSILGFIGAGFLVLAGVLFAFLGAMGEQFGAAGLFDGYGPLVGLVYLVLGGAYVVPSWLLWRYAGSIGRFTTYGAMEQLAEAVVAQKSFWRFAGISSAVLIGLYVLAIGVGFMAAIISAAGG